MKIDQAIVDQIADLVKGTQMADGFARYLLDAKENESDAGTDRLYQFPRHGHTLAEVMRDFIRTYLDCLSECDD